MYEKFLKYLVIIVLIGLLTCLIGVSFSKSISKEHSNDYFYNLTEFDARYNYNKNSVDFLNNNFSNTNIIISPITIQKSYYNYMCNNNICYDSLFSLFDNGLFDFYSSGSLLEDDLIKTFSAGISNNSSIWANINAPITDKLVLDEINAKIQTLSGSKVLYSVNSSNVFNYNIFGLCVLDSQLKVDSFIEEETAYIVDGFFETYTDKEIFYVEIPLENENYSIIFKKELDKKYDKFLPLQTELTYNVLRLPKINYESVEYSAKMFVNTDFGTNFSLDSNLNNLTTICHVNLTCFSDKDTVNTIDTTNIIDLSKNCNFYIQNNRTGTYILLGNFI